MANPEHKTFHCDLIDPTGKLLDCRTTSVVLPAHDGQIGILYNHLPMLCQLGLGIVRVAQGTDAQSQVLFFVDGGFVLVASNSVTIVAYEAFSIEGLERQKVEVLIERTARSLPGAPLSASQRLHENERLRALRKIAESLPA